ncbi:MAG TPA: hypothetical protein DCZ94_08480 [Lentisphaeria bacterium]|nr:MAG: hypothetical protein A2X48_09205 [Lentisphaerae bacterium GWF2_49_21]HBC86974.1 hypothetical protein [Lentisphaeria bacterium]
MSDKDRDFHKTSIHKTVKGQLIELFKGCKLGARLPSTRALTRDLDASYMTINRILLELEWEGYIQRIPRKGTFLSSRERTVSSGTRTGTIPLKTVIFAYPQYYSYPIWQRLNLTEEKAIKRGWAVLEYKMNAEASYDGLVRLVKENDSACGVIIVSVPKSLGIKEISILDSIGIPIVLLDYCDLVSNARQVWSLSPDWYQKGYLSVQTMISHGHRKLAYIKAEPGGLGGQSLRLGQLQALKDSGLKQRDFKVFDGETRSGESSRSAGYELFRKAMKGGRFTGVLFDSVAAVRGATRAAWEMKLKIPEDVSILALSSDNGDESFFGPPLTALETSCECEIDQALKCIADPGSCPVRKLSYPSRLIERESVLRI